jgi:hypothetical protein
MALVLQLLLSVQLLLHGSSSAEYLSTLGLRSDHGPAREADQHGTADDIRVEDEDSEQT